MTRLLVIEDEVRFAKALAISLRAHGYEVDVANTGEEGLTLAKRVTASGEAVHLTPKEWQFVDLLVRNPGKLVSQRQVLQEVWGPQYERETDYLPRVHRCGAPQLEPEPSPPRYFITEPGMGYRFEPDPD